MEELTLQDVADELGVHYMTVYRYVRLGMLPARKEGREWRVRRSELDAWKSGPEPAAPAGSGTAWDRRLANRLLAGDEPGAWKVVEAALAGGMSPGDAYREVITPAMRSIGNLWQEGTIGVDEEHAASAVCLRIVGRLSARFARRGLSKGTILLGTSQTELHGLPSAIAGDLLRLAGYDVVDLGPNLPSEAFARAAATAPQLVAVGISATTPGQDDELAATIAALRSATAAPIILGGSAIAGRDYALALGADSAAESVEEAVEIIGSRSG